MSASANPIPFTPAATAAKPGPRLITPQSLAGEPEPEPRVQAPPQAAGKAPAPTPNWLEFSALSKVVNYQRPADFMLMGDCHLTRGSITILSGWPGVGKSRAANALAIAGATGENWMGHRIHNRFRTLIVQCENGNVRLQSEWSEALRGRNLDEWIAISPIPTYGLAFHEAGFREVLKRKIAEWKPGMVVVDAWNRVADGDKQADYRLALDYVFSCLPEKAEEKPAILIVHHLRKKGNESNRKRGRDLLHELAGSYQIGSTARCVFTLEPASSDTRDENVVLTCCKNNDGMEGAPSAWQRRNGLFNALPDFDMEAFLNPNGDEDSGPKGTRIRFEQIAKAMRGMVRERKGQAVQRLVDAEVCSRATAYRVLEQFPENLTEDDKGLWWWREE